MIISGLLLLGAAASIAMLATRASEKAQEQTREIMKNESNRFEKGVSFLSSLVTFVRDIFELFVGSKKSKTPRIHHQYDEYWQEEGMYV